MKIIIMKAEKTDWYCDMIGKTFKVCMYDYKHYLVWGKNNKLIKKSDCEVIEK